MDTEEIKRGIEAMQAIQRSNPASSDNWKRASNNLRKLVGLLNGAEITPEMWEKGVTS